ncbi:helix-turn-helix transcriptional regulator [Paenibacillus sp. FSL F4-0122]|uniref:helix-turn-helix domain-containing protein n=1 Tax=Paenibacillus sp. FSL F4-0122 TaxID=2921371 RepID=UPI0030F7F038
MRTLGQQVRNMRLQRNVGLTDYAQELGVSTGYLSNFETGKTETIHLAMLEKILSDLGIGKFDVELDSATAQQLNRINSLLTKLHNESPEAFQYFTNNLEQGIELFNKLGNK